MCGIDSDIEMKMYGLLVGILCFFLAFIYSYWLLKKFDLNRKTILNLVLISTIGHFAGAYALYWFALTYGSDSCFYFKHASMDSQGFGYSFAFFVLGYMKTYLVGESFLGAFLLSGALGLIGSVYYVVTYKILLDKIVSRPHYFDPKQLIYPAMLLLCWPSYFFWSAALVKDNFAFLSIAMILFVLANGRLKVSTGLTFLIGCFLGFMVRPYLFVIFLTSAIIYIILGSKQSILSKIILLSSIVIITLLLMPLLSQYGSSVSLNSTSNIGEYVIRQQNHMSVGSSIAAPTQNSHLIFLYLPYLILVNLFLPLGIGATNFIGAISSLENAYLLWWIIFFIKNKFVWRELKNKLKIMNFFLVYFLFGMACLGLMCTNFGLAMREKMMYVPALLICMFLTYAYRRMLILKNYPEIPLSNV